MSFILEALKKSENERQRHSGPSLTDIRIRRRDEERPWWVIGVAALLVVNLGVLAIVLIRNSETQLPPAAAALQPEIQAAAGSRSRHPAPSPALPRPQESRPDRNLAAADGTHSPASPSTLNSASRSPAVRSLADEADPYGSGGDVLAPYTHLAAAAGVPDGPPMVRRIEAPAVTLVPRESLPEAARTGTDPGNEVLPTVSDMLAGGTSLPDMHLDIHVYSGIPAERFIFVNMRKYIEGQSLSEGPQVERITPDGVVLNHRGLRFLLTRQ
ncbi:hypothetical protein ACG33_00255 [Steroidobacter denitrificans]|uniref:Type II secretion system protein GspB C-terminal domain-containing protein n=1 Tax=Steroidobacter denitrificans TaxID=465721 RepID=A0A127F7I8_STEDE|nr:general secretion pathway protein GspB [Steroidobacter denitrificans]AMN45558.1 hypothetical protein ACG33_00255 [Steroidobacter denitrificans]